jgi:hypothetical protein
VKEPDGESWRKFAQFFRESLVTISTKIFSLWSTIDSYKAGLTAGFLPSNFPLSSAFTVVPSARRVALGEFWSNVDLTGRR